MSFLAWIAMGLIAGILASMAVPARTNWLVDIVLGIVGASIGGFIFNTFGAPGVSGFNLYSIMVAFVGAVVLLAILRALPGGKALV